MFRSSLPNTLWKIAFQKHFRKFLASNFTKNEFEQIYHKRDLETAVSCGIFQNHRPLAGHRPPTTDPPTTNHRPPTTDPPTDLHPTNRPPTHWPTDHIRTDSTTTNHRLTDHRLNKTHKIVQNSFNPNTYILSLLWIFCQ